jgi:hypothetical protein
MKNISNIEELKIRNGPYYLHFNIKKRSAQFSPNITAFESDDGKVKDFYINYENETQKIATQNKDFILLFTTNRNKIPLYVKSGPGILEISPSPNILRDDNPINFDAILSVLAGARYDTGCVFAGIESLLPSSIYEYNFKNDLLKYKGLKLYPVKSTRDKLLEKLVFKFKSLLVNGQNVYIMISAGYDSRLELALIKHAAKEYGNRIIMSYIYTDNASKKIVNRIAEKYGYNIKTFDSKELINNFDYEKVRPYLSGYFPVGIYMYFSMVDIIKKQDPDSIIIGYNLGTLKGKYYYKKGYDWPSKAYFPNIESLIRMAHGAGYSQNDVNALIELNQEFVKNAIRISEVYENKYQKFDVINMLLKHSSHGKRSYPFIAYHGMPFCVDDDEIENDFISLPVKHKIDASFILYALAKLDKNLLKIPFISGNYDEFTNIKIYKITKFYEKMLNKFKKSFLSNPTDTYDFEAAYLDLIADINKPSFLPGHYMPEKLCRYILENKSVKWKTKLIFTGYLDYIRHASM